MKRDVLGMLPVGRNGARRKARPAFLNWMYSALRQFLAAQPCERYESLSAASVVVPSGMQTRPDGNQNRVACKGAARATRGRVGRRP
ncbi:MAG: hypothetical protein AB1700_14505 [Bacillota bacterium]